MPSPAGHTLGALVVHVVVARDHSDLWDARRAVLIVGAAVAPDLDLLLNLFDGRNYHQAESHSVGFALLAGLAAVVFAVWRRWQCVWRLGASVSGAWVSHILLDFLNRDTNPPIGLMALWPLDRGYYKSPWPVLLDIGRTLGWETLINNTLAVLWECLVLTPVLVLAVWLRGRLPGPGGA